MTGFQAPGVRMWAGWAAEALCGGNRLALSCLAGLLCGRAVSFFLAFEGERTEGAGRNSGWLLIYSCKWPLPATGFRGPGGLQDRFRLAAVVLARAPLREADRRGRLYFPAWSSSLQGADLHSYRAVSPLASAIPPTCSPSCTNFGAGRTNTMPENLLLLAC